MGVYESPTDTPVDDLLVCTDDEVIRRLRLEYIVGKGGFATVWRAVFDGQACACKVLQPRGGTLPPAPIVRLFVRECSSLMSMEHRSVVRCFGLIRLRMADVPELGLSYDTYGMLLEYCEGGTLKDLLLAQLTSMRDQYTVREALGWLAQVAAALRQFHSLDMPIIHRDIKPDNVLLQVVPADANGQAGPPLPSASRKRRGSNSGRGGDSSVGRGGVALDARLADLGLGVRVGADRNVLIRRRVTPTTTMPASSGGPDVSDLERIEIELAAAGAGGGGGGAAAAVSGEGRLPFMGFTTTALPKAASKRGSGGGAPSPAAAAADGGSGGAPAASSPAPSAHSTPLHKATLLNNLRARLSSRRVGGVGHDAPASSPLATVTVAAAAAPSGSTSRGSSAPGSPPTAIRQAAAVAAVKAAAAAAAGGAGGGGGSGGGARPISDGGGEDPSPFRDWYLRGEPGAGSAPESPVLLPAERQPRPQPQPPAAAVGAAAGPAPPPAAPPSPPGLPEEVTVREDVAGAPGNSSPYVSINDAASTCNGGGGAAAAAEALPLGPEPPLPRSAPPAAPAAPGSPSMPSPFALGPGPSVAAPAGGGQSPGSPEVPAAAAAGAAAPTAAPAAAAAAATATATPLGLVPFGHSHSLGTAHTHGAAPHLLPPISERSLSADDTVGGASGVGGPGGGDGGVSGVDGAKGGGGAAGVLPGVAPMALGPLYTIEEPEEGGGTGPALPAAPSAVATAASAPGFLAQLRASLFRTASRQRSSAPAAAAAGAAAAAAAHRGGAGGEAGLDGGEAGEGADQRSHSTPRRGGGSGADLGLGDTPSPRHAPNSPAHQQHPDSAATSPAAAATTTTARLGHAWSDRHAAGGGGGLAGTMSRGSRPTGTTQQGQGQGLSVRAGSLPRSDTLASAASAALLRAQGSLRSVSSLLRPNLRELRTTESINKAMRKVGSLLRSLNKSSLPKFSPDSNFQWVFALTGHAGSCMYMAPEVFRAEPYNEKVDVFSFGVMMYELLARELLLVKYVGGTRAGAELGVSDPRQYAKKVCEGFRPPRSPRIPEAQWQLIQACWHPDPVVRPDIGEVCSALEAALQAWDWQHTHPQSRGRQQHQQQSQQQQQQPQGAAGPHGSAAARRNGSGVGAGPGRPGGEAEGEVEGEPQAACCGCL